MTFIDFDKKTKTLRHFSKYVLFLCSRKKVIHVWNDMCLNNTLIFAWTITFDSLDAYKFTSNASEESCLHWESKLNRCTGAYYWIAMSATLVLGRECKFVFVFSVVCQVTLSLSSVSLHVQQPGVLNALGEFIKYSSVCQYVNSCVSAGGLNSSTDREAGKAVKYSVTWIWWAA